MIIFKRAIPRRTFLRGAGTTLALPLLDAMIPASVSAAPAAKPSVRLSFVYVPCGIGDMTRWTPAAEGAAYKMTPILEPLAQFRDRFLVLSGFNSANWHKTFASGGNHPRAAASMLTGLFPTKERLEATGRPGDAGISADQIAAKELGKFTQLASLEVAVDGTDCVGKDDDGYSAAYTNTISWRGYTTPTPMENNPRAVFERLFGDSDNTAPAVRQALMGEDRSILDAVYKNANKLLAELGPADNARLTEYLDSIRDVERRLQRAEEQSSRELPTLERPVGIPPTYGDHVKLMFDLQVLALQSDLTRVLTFMMAREQSSRSYPEIGVADPHHPMSHHMGNTAKIEKVVKINIYHAKLFAYFLEKLQSTPDGDGSLLDHSMIVYGSGMSDGDQHSWIDLPILLAGGGVGQIKGGRHIRYPKDTPITNLYLTILDKAGFPVENLGDSTGKLALASV